MTSYTQNNIDTRLAMYTLAAGALVAGNAQAAPTESTSGFPVGVQDSSVQIFIDDDGFPDFTLSATTNPSCDFNGGFSQLTSNPSYAGGVLFNSGPEYAGMISAGSTVSAGSSFSTQPYLVTCGTDNAELPVTTRGFVGVKFQNSLDETFYGYLAVETKSGDGGLIASVLGACYESEPDVPIELDACDLERSLFGPKGIPVGGLIPMSLAVLAVGAAAMRRRKRVQQ